MSLFAFGLGYRRRADHRARQTRAGVRHGAQPRRRRRLARQRRRRPSVRRRRRSPRRPRSPARKSGWSRSRPTPRATPPCAVSPRALTGFSRIVYLSTVGVYGDSGGAWVDETSPLLAVTPRARARVAAEAAWRAFGADNGVAVDILRLGGIYGPGRGAFDRLREGTARRVVKPGQVFNRIHVDDIAGAIETVVAAGRPGEVYNVIDGAPSPPEDVIAYAAGLLGLAPPPEEPYATAGLTAMAASFYEENRRVRNDRLRALGWSPQFPSYREGLVATLAEETRAALDAAAANP